MDKFNDFPNDLNDWSLQNFKEVMKIFERNIDSYIKKFYGKSDATVENSPNNREKIIGKDDITNLRILLGKANTIEEFIKNI